MVRWLFLAVFAVAVALGLAYTFHVVWPALFDPAADPKRSEPPPPITSAQPPARLLFDGSDLSGWDFKGAQVIRSYSLILGGKEACVARLKGDQLGDFTLAFDFFEAGTPKTRLTVDFAPKDAGGKPESAVHDLNLGNYVHPRWHHAVLTCRWANGHIEADLDIKPIHDGYGLSAHRGFVRPAAQPASATLRFEAEAGSMLYLRNLTLTPIAPSPTPPAKP